MEFNIVKATLVDIPDILNIYYRVYKNDYPLSLGTNADEIKVALLCPDRYLWLIAKDPTNHNKSIGSIIFQIDKCSRTGKVMGVAVMPGYQGRGVAKLLIQKGTTQLLELEKDLDALYTTTRTVSVASQLLFLKNGYYSLGIFPNAHKIHSFETLTFMGYFRKNVLENRQYIYTISPKLKPLLKISNRILGKKRCIMQKKEETVSHTYDLKYSPIENDFEFILAPSFVKKRFQKTFPKEFRDKEFTPFEDPNLLIVATESDFELYAHLSHKDHYCAIIGTNQEIDELGTNNLKRLIFNMKDYGINYIEVLIRLDNDKTINCFLENQFLPSAICPAFKKEADQYMDFIFLSRTMQPLDFSGMQVSEHFKGYIDQYVKSWIDMHVSSLEVVGEKK